jgi:hypothetical protein
MPSLKKYARVGGVVSVFVMCLVLAGWSTDDWRSQNGVVVTNGPEHPIPVYAPKQILVTLDNTPQEPGVVQTTNDPVNDPLNIPELGPAIGSGGFAIASAHLQDPPSVRAVIEEASGDLKLTHGSKPLYVQLTTTVNGNTSKVFLPATFMGTDFTGMYDHYSVSEHLLLYADPDTDVTLTVSTTSGPGGQVTFDLEGGFVPVVKIE